MKKVIFAIALSLTSLATVSAQDEAAVSESGSALVSRKGIAILPQAGDFAIGVEATPYLNYFGNMFSGYTDEKNTLDLGAQTIYGRYFLADDAAVRVMFKIDNSTDVDRSYVRDDAAYYANPLSTAQTQDAYTSRNREYVIGLGYQKYRGYGRLRGFYGAQLMVGFEKDSYEYSYGNPITSLNTAPTTSYYGSVATRTLKGDDGLTTSFGIGALAGVEYYFAPKVCIGGEISLMYGYSKGSQSNYTTERWNGSNVVEEEHLVSPGDTHSQLSTDRPATFGWADNVGGNLYLMFHF